MVDDILRQLTGFGDQAVILPVVAGTALLLLVQGRRAACVAWLVGAGAVLSVVLAAKLLFLGCGWRLGPAGPYGVWPTSPSGHTASAAVVCGNLAVLMGAGGSVRRIWPALATSLAVACLVGTTRIALGAHTVADVVAGGVIGCAGTLAFGRYLLPRLEGERQVARRPGLNLAALAVFAGVGVLASGHHLAIEATIIRVANEVVRGYVPVCVRV